MQVSDLSAGDIMVPRAQMDAINAEDSIDQIVAFAVEKAHSRFPVYEGERDNVIGVLLAKTCFAYTPIRMSICATCCARQSSFQKANA